MNFVIVSPRQKWGGAIVLHSLCKNLNEMGYDASIFYTEIYGIGNKPLISKIKYIIKWLQYSIHDYFDERNEKYTTFY